MGSSLIFFATTSLLSSNLALSLLLSDLPTPSFVIDLPALRRIALTSPAPTLEPSNNTFLPSIRLPASGRLFRPYPYSQEARSHDQSEAVIIDVTFPVEEGQPSIGFLHSSVIRAREAAIPGEDDPISTFLAEIDLNPSLCGVNEDESPPAKLVLGLNNHHVGSYYWARSAGAGASMEAPGVSFGFFDDSTNRDRRGILRWLDEGGPLCCNSNDGKRSEWVNFLRKGDTVQLVPTNGQKALIQMREIFGTKDDNRIFGVSLEGRPMGSEPEVLCEWRQIVF
eukprot:CCRYP_010550-RA/>CCRYP_010550-RA protein AED:0.02 eAED:-0.00 QI:0/0/0/0.5/1/1/2/0/280